MLTIVVPGEDCFDEVEEVFSSSEATILELEHSLVSLSKWESIFEKSFLGSGEKNQDEIISYIECMTLTTDFPPEVFSRLTEENIEQINKYIDAKMTATWFSDTKESTKNQETITAELIYYWLTVFSIPFEVQHWHLNRLFTLLRICNVKNTQSKKMTRTELAERNRQLNAQRKAQLGTTG